NETIATIAGFGDAAGCSERSKALIEGGGTDAAFGAQFGEGDRGSGGGERCRNPLIQRGWHRRYQIAALDKLKREGFACFDELDLHRLQRRSVAVLDGQGQSILIRAQIEIAVSPGVELRGAARRLACTDVAGTLLGVVDE